MQNDDEIKELLTEIRDALINHTKRYDEYLRDYDKLVSEQKELYGEARKGSYEQWAFMGVIMFAAVALARIFVP